ncbi:PREDICTED: Retrovirus-related Pol poly from transposon, partial [Prunus dulcis]
AFNDPKWAEAMNIEMDALQKNNTWDIVDLPKGTKPVGFKWMFTVKYNEYGIVERYK